MPEDDVQEASEQSEEIEEVIVPDAILETPPQPRTRQEVRPESFNLSELKAAIDSLPEKISNAMQERTPTKTDTVTETVKANDNLGAATKPGQKTFAERWFGV
jgi:hypothetical protein